MKRISEWQSSFSYYTKYVQKKGHIVFTTIRYFYNEKDEFTPIQRELYKFKPDSNFYPYKWHFMFLGCFIGLTGNLIYNKVFYEDFQIRELGCGQYDEISAFFCFYRFAWYYIFKGFMGHPLKTKQGEEFTKNIVRLKHYDHYMKKRSSTFDFMYIGELEQFQFD